jgi:hypothetical protein
VGYAKVGYRGGKPRLGGYGKCYRYLAVLGMPELPPSTNGFAAVENAGGSCQEAAWAYG